MGIWVLTRELNQYDQDGEYFVAAFQKKPTEDQLVKQGVTADLNHVLQGGGREKWEDEWWYLREVKNEN